MSTESRAGDDFEGSGEDGEEVKRPVKKLKWGCEDFHTNPSPDGEVFGQGQFKLIR